MYDPLLFEYEITIPRIMRQVASITKVDVEFMQIPDGMPQARKREFVNARQISMKLSKKYTKSSLTAIGFQHGGRDHATVLHACKAINNMLDTKDPLVYDDYKRLDRIVKEWKKEDEERMNSEHSQENTIFNAEK